MERQVKIEEAIHIACCQWWDLVKPEKHILFHVPNGELRHPAVARKLAKMGVVSGVWDLCMIGPSVPFAWVEVKSPTGKLTIAQREFRDILDAAWVKHAVARSLDDFVDICKEWKVPVRQSSLFDRK
jgi:hypothetical protein